MSAIAAAWGALLALPFVRWARRQAPVTRARALAPPVSARRRPRRDLPRPVAIVAAVLSAPVRHRRRRAAEAQLAHELPVAVDLLAVAVGAGCTPYVAIEVAAAWCPPAIGGELAAVTDACRLGATFEGALQTAAQRSPALTPIADALDAAARLGAPVGATLARLSSEARADLRRRAEARARTVPVRLLFPLVFLVLPAFGLLTVAPVLLDGFRGS